MKTRKLGYTSLNLSVVGLGTWPFSNTDHFGWGPQSDKDTIATVQRAMEVGVNWIDCAPIYGHGQSEEAVGRALKTLSKKPIIATKALFQWKPDGMVQLRLDRESVRKQYEGSLKRLGIDFIDMYMIHWPFAAEYLEEGWTNFRKIFTGAPPPLLIRWKVIM